MTALESAGRAAGAAATAARRAAATIGMRPQRMAYGGKARNLAWDGGARRVGRLPSVTEAAMNLRRLLPVLGILVLVSVPALARVDVTLDADTLNELLSKMAPDHVPVDLHSGKTLDLQLKDVKVTGFDPAAGPNGGILTSLRLLVPEVGIDTPATPPLTLAG